MRRLTIQSLLSLIVAGCLTITLAGNPAIGLVMAKGSFRVDDSQVWGNATVLDGAIIETAQVASRLHLNSGARLRLAAGSRGKVHQDRLVLERGVSQLENAARYWIEARGLRVFASGANAAAQVALDKENRVVVAALRAPVQVSTEAGIVVANVAPGAALAFQPQAAGAAPPARLRGCLETKNGRFLLRDETAGVTVELIGAALAAEVGNVIEVEGITDVAAKPAAEATQVVRAHSIKRVGACKAAAAAGAAAGGAAAGGWAGLAVAAKVAIIAGVAVTGATVGILAARGEEEERPPLSP